MRPHSRPGRPHEKFEQPIFPRAQLYDFIVAPGLPGNCVKAKICDSQHDSAIVAAAPCQRPHAREQFLQFKRLWRIIISPGV